MVSTTSTALSRRLRAVAVLCAATLAGTAALTTSSFHPAVADTHLQPIAKGGFENPGSGADIPGWSQLFGANGDGDITVVDTTAYAGDHSLLIEDRDESAAFGLVSDPVPVQADESYELSLWVWLEDLDEPDDTIHGKAYLYFYDDDGTRVHSVSTHFRDLAHEEWARVTLSQAAPSDATSVSVLLYSEIADSSTFYVDEVSLRHQAPLTITDLGVGMETANVRLAKTDVLPDGTPVGYLMNNGSPMSLNVVDLGTGELIQSHDVDEHTMISSGIVDDNHMFYFSGRNPSPGTLWRYDPLEDKLEMVVETFDGETSVTDMVIADGTLYLGTFPSAAVWAYDLESGNVDNLGSVSEVGEYARALEFVGQKLWVGTSTSPQLIELDVVEGQQTERELPPDMASGVDFFSSLNAYDDLVVARYSPANESNASIYDQDAEEWNVVDGGMGLLTTETAGEVFYFARGNEVLAFNVRERIEQSIGWSDSDLANSYAGTSRISLVDLNIDEFGESTLIGVRQDGAIWRFNPHTQHGDLLENAVAGAPARIHSIGVGPGGDPHFGAYLSSGVLARVDHETGVVEQLTGPSQADAFAATTDSIVVGTYPDASFYGGSVHEEWDWLDNPSHLVTIGRTQGQDRVSDMTAVGSRVAAVTVPNFGESGGALVLIDPHTGDYELHADLVAEQSLVSVTHRDGVVYGGSSIHGAINTDPTQQEAELFAWDVSAGRLLFSEVVVEDAEIIHSLTFDDNGMLWGMTDTGVLFEYDVSAGEVSRSTDTGLRNPNIWGRTSEIYQNPADSLMYGNAGSRLFKFDPETLEFSLLPPSGVRYSTVVWDGSIYFATDTNVFRLDPHEAVEPVEVTPPPVTFDDRPGTANDYYTVPGAEGVAYSVDGADATSGRHPGSGTLTVRARALPGYVVAEDAELEWTHTFDDGGADPSTPIQQVQAVQTDLAVYIEAGDIAGPVAHQLSNALDQAVNHLEGGRPDPAAQALERVTQHLENPKEPDTVSEQAQTDLLAQVRSVLDQVG